MSQAPTGPSVLITGSALGLETVARYDIATGVMLGQRVATANSGTSTQLELQQMP